MDSRRSGDRYKLPMENIQIIIMQWLKKVNNK
jgi:hypothetical protein